MRRRCGPAASSVSGTGAGVGSRKRGANTADASSLRLAAAEAVLAIKAPNTRLASSKAVLELARADPDSRMSRLGISLNATSSDMSQFRIDGILNGLAPALHLDRERPSLRFHMCSCWWGLIVRAMHPTGLNRQARRMPCCEPRRMPHIVGVAGFTRGRSPEQNACDCSPCD